MREIPVQGALGDARRQTGIARAPARAATGGGRPPETGAGGMIGGKRLPEIETTAVVARIEIEHRVVRGARVVMEIGVSRRRVVGVKSGQRGLI